MPGEKVTKTEAITPDVHADFDGQGRLIGLEILDASEVLQHKVQFEVTLTSGQAEVLA